MGYVEVVYTKIRCSQCHGTSFKDITRHSIGGFVESIRMCLTCGHEKVLSVTSSSTTQSSAIYYFEVPKPFSLEEF